MVSDDLPLLPPQRPFPRPGFTVHEEELTPPRERFFGVPKGSRKNSQRSKWCLKIYPLVN